MTEPGRRPQFLAFLLGTKAGRMTLFGLLVAILAFILPAGCTRRAKRASGESEIRAEMKETGDVPPSPRGFDETLTLGQRYDSLIRGWGQDLSSTKGELDLARRDLEGLRKELEGERAQGRKEKAALETLLRKLEEGLRREGGGGGGSPLPNPGDPGKLPEGTDPVRAQARDLGLRTIRLAEPARAEKRETRIVHIPAATGGEATLLNGVFAPISGEPSPVRLRFDAALLGPNRSRVGLQEAYLIGKAQGDANSSRVLVQIDRLSYVTAGGRSIEAKVLGYVVGRDQLEGVPGSYEWRATELLPIAIGAGAVGAGTDALAMNEASRSLTPLGGAIETVSGNPLKYAGFKSLSGGSNKLSEILAERLKEIRPAVSAAPGQEVTVVFLEGVTLEGLPVEEVGDDPARDPFRGLDLHR